MRIIPGAILAFSFGPLVSSAMAQNPPQERVRVERAADLPVHTYRLTTSVSDLIRNTAQFTVFAKQLEADLRADLAKYIIEDAATLKFYYAILSELAVERGEYDAAVAFQDLIRGLEDKPAEKLLTGIIERSLAQAARSSRDRFADNFRDVFRREVSSLPYADVRSQLAMLRQGAEYASTPNAFDNGIRMLEQQIRRGSLSLQDAQMVVRLRSSANRNPPIAPVIAGVLNEVITAHDAAVKADIWPGRGVSLEGRAGLEPVVAAVWDSGVDVTLFRDRLFVNAREVPGNGRDDDGNGYVDDVHGIAYNLKHDRTMGVLGPITHSVEVQNDYAKHMQGQADLAAGISSAEARAFREKLFALGPANMPAWVAGMAEYDEYIHGTTVAGVVVIGNPAVRLLVARTEEDYWKPAPQVVTIETETKRAREFRETVEYFTKSGVRVVNMSWAYSPRWYEATLAKNQPSGDIESRKRQARELFEITARGLREAIESAPDVLFVTGAGNANDDIRFNERVPSGFQLANLITTGAVDSAGNEARFTSYGNVHVYANGSAVPSVVPGGATVPASGTSIATPQVVNLAAKLLALKPGLTMTELRRAILESADERKIVEGKTIRLLNPRAALERVTNR